MKIHVNYIPNTRYYGCGLLKDYVWRWDGSHLHAVTVYRRKLIDMTDIPF